MGKKTSLYFGWRVFATGFIIIAFVFAPALNLNSLFVKPLAEHFMVPRTVITGVLASAAVAGLLSGLVTGRVLARVNIRNTVIAALCLLVVCYVLLATVQSLVVLSIAFFVRGVAVAFAGLMPISILISNWFGKRMLGRVWSFVVMGTGIGSMIFSPIAGAIIENLGWRHAYVLFGLLAIPIIPLVAVNYVTHPQDKGLARIGDVVDGDKVLDLDNGGIPAKRAVRTGMFWLLIFAIFMMDAAVESWMVNGTAYLTDFGFDMVWVSFLLSIVSVGITLGKLLLGFLCDKFSPKIGMLVGGVLLISGYLLALAVGRVALLAYPMALVLGAGLSVTLVTTQLMTRDLFGNKAYVVLAGFSQSALSTGALLGPSLASLVFEFTGSYAPAWLAACACMATAIVLIFFAYKMRPGLMEKYGEAE
ncbi:MAG: MFS transporter [Oscillospiraceae bacterium]